MQHGAIEVFVEGNANLKKPGESIMLDSQKEVMVTGRVYGVARCSCEVRVYYGVHQSDEAWWHLCNVSVAADGTFSTCIGPSGRLVDGKPRPYFHLNRRSVMAVAKKRCKQATLPEDAYVCIRVTAEVWSEEATEESMAMLHGFSAPIDIKTGRQFRSINAASSSPQASAHQHVAKELKKDAALTECVAEILKQPAAVREEFLEQWRQWQLQSVVQCSALKPVAAITADHFREHVYNLFKPAGAPDFVVFFVEHANGATILLSAEQTSLMERRVYAPCSPEEIAEDDPYAACETYSLSSHNKNHAKQLTDFVSNIKGLCEPANHEVFSIASKGLFERQLTGKGQQDGRFVFEQPLHVDEKDAAEMPQEEYDARFLFCSLLAAVLNVAIYNNGTGTISPVDAQSAHDALKAILCQFSANARDSAAVQVTEIEFARLVGLDMKTREVAGTAHHAPMHPTGSSCKGDEDHLNCLPAVSDNAQSPSAFRCEHAVMPQEPPHGQLGRHAKKRRACEESSSDEGSGAARPRRTSMAESFDLLVDSHRARRLVGSSLQGQEDSQSQQYERSDRSDVEMEDVVERAGGLAGRQAEETVARGASQAQHEAQARAAELDRQVQQKEHAWRGLALESQPQPQPQLATASPQSGQERLDDFCRRYALSEYCQAFMAAGYVFADDLREADGEEYAEGRPLALILATLKRPERKRLIRLGMIKS